jgi:gas vesicle protein GvpL/GvpF
MPLSSEFWYVYGVVPVGASIAHAPDGLDETRLELCPEGNLAAVVSRLDGERYAPGEIERGTADVEWLAPRAVAHDRVLTWMSDHGPVVPLPIFSMFSGAPAVREMLSQQRSELESALTRVSVGREYALRVYRIDSELTAIAGELSPRLAELQSAADAATPGQRYLIERKLDSERKNELQVIGARIAREIVNTLRPLALDTAETRVTQRTARPGAEGMLILEVAFLVSPAGLNQFQGALTELVRRHGARGFRFDFTGPWPPYHFVQRNEAAAHGA